VFIDPKLGSTRFAEECVKWISRHPGTDATKEAYRNILHAHVEPVLGDRTLAGVAQARGLRIEEALAVRKSCFRDGGTVLCVFEQASRDGSQCHLDDSRRICLAGQAQPVFPLHSPVVADSQITQHARNIRNLQIL